LKAFGIVAVAIAAVLVIFALPIEKWRTGDQGLAPLDSVPEVATPPFPRRVWIDTDAACGHSPRTDPDDCFAIALLLRSPEVHVVGISTVAGNAPREVVAATTRAIAGTRVAVNGDLRMALEQGPLTIVALGPLTNIAAVLREHPELRKNVARLIAVMGRRPGHIFHPAEGAGGGMLFGHGPVFRDFNFALDPDAAAQVLAMKLPVSLVPYDAARGIELIAADLDQERDARHAAMVALAEHVRVHGKHAAVDGVVDALGPGIFGRGAEREEERQEMLVGRMRARAVRGARAVVDEALDVLLL
jgi:inosine-uridine nucleoside N-ribohydrolase